MTTLRLTDDDTKPIAASLPYDITGYTIHLLIGAVDKTATITSAANGQFQFARTPGDLAVGQYDSALVITDPAGYSETSDLFNTVVTGRPA